MFLFVGSSGLGIIKKGVELIINEFRAEVAWPEDWPETQAGEAPAEAPGDAEEARMDEEMTYLLSFLGGSGAT